MQPGTYQKRARELGRKLSFPAIIAGGDLAYFTGLPLEGPEFLCVGRNGAEIFSWDPELIRRSPFANKTKAKSIAGLLAKRRVKKIGMREPKKIRGVKVEDISAMLDRQRLVKDAAEIKAIRKACAYADRAMSAARESIRPGVTEKAIRNELLHSVMHKAQNIAFDPIVASGENTMPIHLLPTDRKIRAGETIIIDIGFRHDTYCSDLTRTFSIRPTKEQRKTYGIVERAQQIAIDYAYPNMEASELAKEVNGHLEKEGQMKHARYALGHGVGTQVHEPPSISEKSKDTLPAGSVFTLEPGLHPKTGGVRIEDTFVMTGKGARPLTRSGKGFEP